MAIRETHIPVNPLRVIFVGGQSLLIRCAEILQQKGHFVSKIITDDPNDGKWANQHNVDWSMLSCDLVKELAEVDFDYLFCINLLVKCPPEVINAPRKFAINYHDGPLPKFAGLNAPIWAIVGNEKMFGVTWHIMTSHLDKGDIISQTTFPIDDDETALTLNAKCYEAAYTSFEALLDNLYQDQISRQPQDVTKRTYYGRKDRVAAAGILDWRRPADELETTVRALNFGNYQNPLTTAKLLVDGVVLTVRELVVTADASRGAPGTVVGRDQESITVATGTFDVVARNLYTLYGDRIDNLNSVVGDKDVTNVPLPTLSKPERARIAQADTEFALHENFWIDQIAGITPLELPLPKKTRSVVDSAGARMANFKVYYPDTFWSNSGNLSAGRVRAAFVAYLSRVCSQSDFTICCDAPAVRELSQPAKSLCSEFLPINISIDHDKPFEDFLSGFDAAIENATSHASFPLDIFQRRPAIREKRRLLNESIRISIVDSIASVHVHEEGPAITLLIEQSTSCFAWLFDESSISVENIATLHDGFITLLFAMDNVKKTIAEYPVISDTERLKILEFGTGEHSDTKLELVHERISKTAKIIPAHAAIVAGDKTVSFAELDRQSNKIAKFFSASGLNSGSVIAVLMDRNECLVEMLVGTLKSGAAYLPLDTRHPSGRLAAIIDNAQPAAVICDRRNADLLAGVDAQILVFEEIYDRIQNFDGKPLSSSARGTDACYVIYTSGSTGAPKGVVVEHDNLANFCQAMDQSLPVSNGGTWLAVTSISFDISVLELLWTVSRGFKVVLYDADMATNVQILTEGASAAAMPTPTISLFYFSSDGEDSRDNAYALLQAGARFADANGFEAVWVPERHFHRFGGLYPNPAVLAATLAPMTSNIKLRAGSCVLPLHKILRVAEEWSVVDNLSNGRIGLSCASGWQPSDFVLAPDCYEDRHNIMREAIENLRSLWRGEKVTLPGPRGPVEVGVFPRPVQREIPLWITAAKSPETFELAGHLGANVLTHLLGQGFEELKQKIQIYRQARRDAGHETEGVVTLMLHTFVNDDADFVLDTVRDPMMNYLMSATDLVKSYASSFPTFRMSARTSIDEKFRNLSKTDLEAVCEHAFQRFYKGDGLFGTPSVCADRVNELARIGINEIACLIDFGIPDDIVVENFENIAKVKSILDSNRPTVPTDNYDGENAPFGLGDSIAELIRKYEVTHLQCTPSLAAILEKSKTCRSELGRLRTMLVGGEIFPPNLAEKLKSLVGGELLNMYGPTETTIWSSCHVLPDAEEGVPIGRPIANTDIFVMNEKFDMVPRGFIGEIFIGGKGVTRGYLGLPDLTAERFIHNPFNTEERIYRTGDLGYWRNDGALEILGRADNQLKILGYRVELDEISRILERHPTIEQAVVDAGTEGTEAKKLTAYLIPSEGCTIDVNDVRDFLKYLLPDYMIPSAYLILSEFPLTTSGKVDRKQLPQVTDLKPLTGAPFVEPCSDIEELLAEEWRQILDYSHIGIFDNFFEIGGDSLKAVELLLRIEDAFLVDIPLSFLFRCPTIAEISNEIAKRKSSGNSKSRAESVGQLESEELMQIADEYGWRMVDDKQSSI